MNKDLYPAMFICSPFAGDTERNIESARRYCKFAIEQGVMPLAPHLLFPQFMDDTDKEQRELGMAFGLRLLRTSSEMWVFGSHISKGMQIEINAAKELSRHIRYFTDECQEVDR